MAYVIKQEKFEGPLGLLLELIEKEKLSISEISLARVAEEYLRFVRGLQNIDPEELAEFLVIAAQLMLIKSRTLLPGLQLNVEEEESIADLEKRLEEYKQMKEFARELKTFEGRQRAMVAREYAWGVDPVFYPPPKLGLDGIAAAFAAFLDALPKIEKLVQEKLKKIISLEEKIFHIRTFLSGSLEKAFSEIVRGSKEKVEVIVSFLAILELARQKFVDLEQENPFDDIIVKKLD